MEHQVALAPERALNRIRPHNQRINVLVSNLSNCMHIYLLTGSDDKENTPTIPSIPAKKPEQREAAKKVKGKMSTIEIESDDSGGQ